MTEEKKTSVNPESLPSAEGVKPWQSWTLWASLITALAPLFPPVQVFIMANPEVLSAVGAVFGALRLKTASQVQVKKAK